MMNQATPYPELNFRAERELRGISLQDLSYLSKIPEKHLALFEEHRFESLPKPFFIKTYLKAYIECLGLDPDMVYLEYNFLN